MRQSHTSLRVLASSWPHCTEPDSVPEKAEIYHENSRGDSNNRKGYRLEHASGPRQTC